MKIIFLCGSLDPGRDGVGDYVRRLSIELIHQGHMVAAMALNDYSISDEVMSLQLLDDKNVLTFRLPSVWPAKLRFKRAEEWINEYGAELLSLQFVPYSFHSIGIPFSLSNQLAQLSRGRQWHLMIHELWVGMDKNASLKHRCIGKIQRHIVKKLILKLKPIAIHTQTEFYQLQINKLGFKNFYLPLFSNIPVSKESVLKASFEQLDMTNTKTSKAVSLIVFGNIHPDAPVRQLAQDAALYSRKYNVEVTLNMIGRCGKEQEHWATTWKSVGLPVKIFGEQSADEISKILLNSNIGISTTPRILIGKSGTAAAMQQHGLPILCVTRSWQSRTISVIKSSTEILEYSKGNFEIYITPKKKINYTDDISNIARQFIGTFKDIL